MQAWNLGSPGQPVNRERFHASAVSDAWNEIENRTSYAP